MALFCKTFETPPEKKTFLSSAGQPEDPFDAKVRVSRVASPPPRLHPFDFFNIFYSTFLFIIIFILVF